jgi:hypothetical protein
VLTLQARSFGVMSPKEEVEVRDLVSRTTETLHRASAGPDDMGSRYARLLELLWKPPHSSASVASTESRRRNEISIPNLASSSSSLHGHGHGHFDPANDFSWLDLGAVGDYVSGDQMAASLLGFDGLQDNNMYGTVGQQQQQQQMWQTPLWTGDSLFF